MNGKNAAMPLRSAHLNRKQWPPQYDASNHVLGNRADDVAVPADPAVPAVPGAEEEDVLLPGGTECLHITALGLTETDFTDEIAFECCKDTLTANGGLFYSNDYYTCICEAIEFHYTTESILYSSCADLTFTT